ncbi:hypothetical protein [Pseudarthrobacter sp. N5]|uniref:hypothetical protein n=1 Tax=Pseudarthrobacter sp. N5 TaxID=3418416 RepID=UPI003CF5C50E
MGDSTTIALNLTFFGTVGVACLMFFGLFLVFTATLVIAGVGRLVAIIVMALFGRLPRNETIAVVHLPGTPDQAGTSDGGAAASTAEPSPSAERPASPVSAATAPLVSRVLRDWNKILSPAGLKPRLRAAVEHHPLVTAVRRQPPVLAEDWAAAVAKADARAMARARAAAPDLGTYLRDLPAPAGPAKDTVEVAPLVESALQENDLQESALQENDAADTVPRSFRKPVRTGPLAMLDTGSLVSLSGHVPGLKGKLPAERH